MFYVAIEKDYDCGDEILGVFENFEDAKECKFVHRVELWSGKTLIGTHDKSVYKNIWTWTPE